MQNVECEFARAAVRSKDAQKQLARTSLNEKLYQAYHVTNYTWLDSDVTTTVKYKKMQIQSCYIDWFLVTKNLKRLQSLWQQVILKLKKLFLDGFHGYTGQMLNINNYSGYKKLLVHVLHW